MLSLTVHMFSITKKLTPLKKRKFYLHFPKHIPPSYYSQFQVNSILCTSTVQENIFILKSTYDCILLALSATYILDSHPSTFSLSESTILSNQVYNMFTFSFQSHHVSCGILVPQPGIEPMPHEVEA